MKKIILCLFVFGCILNADTATVGFNNADPWVVVPGTNFLAGPYNLNVNGVLTPAMCMDDFLEVGGPWTANVTNVNGPDFSNTYLGSGPVTIHGYTVPTSLVYQTEAYLFSELIQPSADRANLQLAAWAIMDANTLDNVISHNNTTVENDILGAYEAVTNAKSAFNPANYEILSDVNPNTTGRSQEFIVATPEPSTYLLFGSGLLIAGVMRFSRRRKQAVTTN